MSHFDISSSSDGFPVIGSHETGHHTNNLVIPGFYADRNYFLMNIANVPQHGFSRCITLETETS